jgi:hypothetical protein
MRPASAAAILLGLSLGGAFPATASHAKTDVVTLDKGDRFYGAIESLQQGMLSLDTDAAGTISIKWVHVVRLVSSFEYEVEDVAGNRLFGTLAEPDKDGEIRIVHPSGDVTTLSRREVFSLAPIERGFWKRIDGSVNFGFSYTQSNQAVQYSLSANARYMTRKVAAGLDVSSIFNSQEDAESASQQNASLTVLRPISAFKGLANVFVLGQAQSNPNQGYDLRSIGGGGFGLFLRQMSGGFTLVKAGFTVDRENVTDSTEVTSSVQAYLGLRFSRYRTVSPKYNVDLSANTFTYLIDSPRFRAQVSFQVSFDVIHNMTLSLNIQDSYDSRPATTDATKNDLSVTSSLGYSF